MRWRVTYRGQHGNRHAGAPSTLDPNAIYCASCEETVVRNAFNAVTTATTAVYIPAGTCHWSSAQMVLSLPVGIPSLRVFGAGSLGTTGGDGATTIIDDTSGNDSLLAILQGDSNPTLFFRLAGLTFQRGTGDLKNSGHVKFAYSGQVRLDHSTFSGHNATAKFFTGDAQGPRGVIDHCVFDNNMYVSGSSFGDEAWHAATDLGSDKFLFFEDNVATTHGINDCDHGGRFVIRYNTMVNAQTHPVGGAGRGRGCRAWEIYGNTLVGTGPQESFNVFFLSSGTGVIWGNVTSQPYSNFVTIHNDIEDASVYPETPPPNGWGFCGPGAPQSGTVNTSGTAVTRTGGANFDTAWPAGTMITIGSGGCGANPESGNCYMIASVSSVNALTLFRSAGTQTGVSYTTGSNWHQNSDPTGYACLDQPGRGVGDLLSGDFNAVPSSGVLNVTQGVDSSSPLAWPNQALEPIYEWLNTWTPSGGGSFWAVYHGGSLVANRDYYLYNTANCVAGGACPTNVGSGTSLPTTCTTGVAFWRTDQNTLYKCTAPNTWTAFYTPHTYPHELTLI